MKSIPPQDLPPCCRIKAAPNVCQKPPWIASVDTVLNQPSPAHVGVVKTRVHMLAHSWLWSRIMRSFPAFMDAFNSVTDSFTAGEHAATYFSSQESKKDMSNIPRQFSLPRNTAAAVNTAATATQQQHSSSRRRTDERPWQTGTLYLHKTASTSLAFDRQRARASGLHSGPRT